MMTPVKSVTAIVGISDFPTRCRTGCVSCEKQTANIESKGALNEYQRTYKNQIVYFDGGMGTLLQERGLQPGELPETWNILHPEIITDIHRSYFEAGANIIKTNTFGANRLKFDNLEEIITKAVENANKARDGFENAYIALDIGPIGKMLKPLGDLDFEKAVEIFAETVKIGSKLNVDLILIETMNDSYETKAAVLAAKENSDLPIFVTTVYDENAKLMTGANPKCMVAILEGLGVDALGLNCSLGPEQMKKLFLCSQKKQVFL